MSVKINYNSLFRQREAAWLQKIKLWLYGGDEKIIKIGNGFGNLSEMLRECSSELKIYEIALPDEAINKDKVIIYDGVNIDLPDKSMDIAVFNLVLHHIPHNVEFMLNLNRIVKKRVILVEETYDNIFQKIHLVWRDWYLNKKAGQPCKIFWNSYLKRSEVENYAKATNLKIVHRETNRHHSYYKELIVLDLI